MNKTAKTTGDRRMALTPVELARLGDGEVAYIRQMTAKEAGKIYPAIKGIPKGIELFSLNAADGTPLALTDSRQAAMAQANEGELAIATVH
jgi:hypothetical protein